MEIYQLTLSNSPSKDDSAYGQVINELADLKVEHEVVRIFFAGFSQAGQTLASLIGAHVADSVVPFNKKAYGPVLKQKAYNIDSDLDHDCLLISNYSHNLQGPFDASAIEYDAALLDSVLLNHIVERYAHVEIVAWSFGVRVARALAERLPALSSKISYAIALAGTVPSVDLNYGIDPQAYDGTLERFTSVMHKQFVKNMCAYVQAKEVGVDYVLEPNEGEISLCSSDDKSLVDIVRSLRDHDEFKCELKLMPTLSLLECQDTNVTYEPITELPAPAFYFDEAFIALGDKIIPPAAQYHYWSEYSLMRLACNSAPGFCLNTFYGPHLCPSIIKDLMLAPVHQRAPTSW